MPSEEYTDYGGVHATATSVLEDAEAGDAGSLGMAKAEKSIEVKSDEECDRLLNDIDFDTDTQMCAFDKSEKLADQLQGVSKIQLLKKSFCSA